LPGEAPLVNRAQKFRRWYQAEVLKLFDKYQIKTTWFTPGHSMETFPAQMQEVADASRARQLLMQHNQNLRPCSPRSPRHQK